MRWAAVSDAFVRERLRKNQTLTYGVGVIQA